jgi:F-type H+-transporting ATPase subunit delta
MTETSNSSNGAPSFQHVADVASQRVARVYAEAVLKAAAAKQQEDAVVEEVRSLVEDVFRKEPEFVIFLTSLAIGRDRRAEVIKKMFGGKASEAFLNFLLVLNDHDRLNLLPTVLAECIDLRERRKGLMRVLVRSAVALPDDQRQRLAGELRQTFGREPVLEERVDPELLGGMIVRVGDWLYDASVRTQLHNIRNQLFESSSHEIQSRRDRFRSD